MKLFGADLGSLTHLPLLIPLFSAESQVTHRPVFTTRHWSDNTVHIRYSWDFPWSPVVWTPHFHCREYGFDPWSGKWDPTCLMAQPPLPKILLIIFMFIRSLGRSFSAYQTITSLSSLVFEVWEVTRMGLAGASLLVWSPQYLQQETWLFLSTMSSRTFMPLTDLMRFPFFTLVFLKFNTSFI